MSTITGKRPDDGIGGLNPQPGVATARPEANQNLKRSVQAAFDGRNDRCHLHAFRVIACLFLSLPFYFKVEKSLYQDILAIYLSASDISIITMAASEEALARFIERCWQWTDEIHHPSRGPGIT